MSNYLKPELIASATENTQLNLNIERIGEIHATVPPLAEQREIAAVLNEIDGTLERAEQNTLRLTALLKERRMALITAAVTGQIDVREYAVEDAVA